MTEIINQSTSQKPQIVVQDLQGFHNKNLKKSQDKLLRGNTYKDLSTICVIPTRGMIPAKVVQSWWGLMTPMNQKFLRIFIIGMEVGDAYNSAIEFILNNSELNKWKYILTLEEDNMPPPDGLLKLYEAINTTENDGPFDVVEGLYWTKGEAGQPMLYGNPKGIPKNFIPQVPIPDTIQECNGLGMGFNLFRLDMFKDSKLQRPFFKTLQEYKPYQGAKMYTQDLRFFEDAGRLGYRFACDTRCRVGHYDYNTDMVW